jgi:hypothetical protein
MNVEVNCTEPSSPLVSVPWLIIRENTELVSKLIWILKNNCDFKFKKLFNYGINTFCHSQCHLFRTKK